MVATIQQIIGKINPKLYAENGIELLKKYGSIEKIPAEEVKPKALEEHNLGYDSSSETLEPVYFFILDLMSDFRLSPEKLIDNFSSSPGSGHFAELGQRATIMQQQATKILGDVNTVLRSVLNIVYDLKEFKIRLQYYDDLNSKDKNKAEAARLALKQIWMDRVDIQKGNSSIKAMAMGQAQFVTLIDAFLVVKDEKDVDKVDLNDRVKRILKPRIVEFNLWFSNSEKELRKRYQLERTYLKSQVNALKLYSRWAKPYLKRAFELEMKEVGREPALVKAFNTILLELTLLGKSKLKIKESALEGKLPLEFSQEKFLRTIKRDYYSCILVDFTFRGIPQRVAQQPHFIFGGLAEVNFKAYVLNDDELAVLNKELEESDLGDVLKLIEGTTTESLEELQEDINSFLEEDLSSEKEIKEKKSDKIKEESNPFLALIGSYEKREKSAKEKTSETREVNIIKPDNFVESTQLRKLASENAQATVFNLFDVYKKSHGMASYT